MCERLLVMDTDDYPDVDDQEEAPTCEYAAKTLGDRCAGCTALK